MRLYLDDDLPSPLLSTLQRWLYTVWSRGLCKLARGQFSPVLVVRTAQVRGQDRHLGRRQEDAAGDRRPRVKVGDEIEAELGRRVYDHHRVGVDAAHKL